MKKCKITKEEAIYYLYEKDLTIREVAEIADMHPVSFSQKMRREWGLTGRISWLKKNILTKEQIIKLLTEDRLDFGEMAERYRVSKAVLRALCDEYEIPEELRWNHIRKNYRFLPGDKVGVFTIVRRGESKNARLYWWVKCPLCDKECQMPSAYIRRNQSCGCLKQTPDYYAKWAKMITPHHTKHGMYKHPLYRLYRGIIARCNYPTNKAYKYYGAKGIKCEFADFQEFAVWALGNGWKLGWHMHRIDHDGNYSAENCMFMSPSAHGTHHHPKGSGRKASTAK